MRIRVALACVAVASVCTAAQAASVSVELNAVETADKQCRITFVIENKVKEPLRSLKLDLAVFSPQHIVQRQLATELGPVRGNKTLVKTFALDGACGDIGSILVNDVSCAPGRAEECIEGLSLSSRIKDVRLYK